MQRLKVFALASVAVLAVGAAASASALAFTKIKNPKAAEETLKAVQVAGAAGEQKFTVGGKTVVCKKATFTGTLAASAAVEEEPVAEEYKECSALGFPAEVTHPACVNGFTFKEGKEFAAGKYEFNVAINCEFKIKVPLAGCEIKVSSPQTDGKVTSENVANKKPKIKANVTEIKQTNTCGLGTGNGTYEGEVEVTEGEVEFV